MKINRFSLMAALALGGLLACSSISYAQEGTHGVAQHGVFSPQQRVDRLNSALQLTNDQKGKLLPYFEDQNKKIQDALNLPQDQRRPKMQAIREDETKEMKSVLTPAQFQKWQKMQQEMLQHHGGGGK